MQSIGNKPITSLAIAWTLFVPLTFFAARGTLSFDPTNGFGVSSLVGNAGSPMYRAEQGLIYALVVAVMLHLSRSIWQSAKHSWPVLLLPATAIVSSAWSLDPVKSLSYGIFIWILTFLGFYLVERFSPERCWRLFLLVGWFVILGSFFFAVFVPGIGVDQSSPGAAWRGVFIHKNHCGIIMVYFLLFALYSKGQGILQKSALVLFAILSLVLIAMSQSRTSWLLFLASLGCVLGLKALSRLRHLEQLLVAVVLLAAVCMLAWLSIAYFPQIAVHLGKDSTLTGRTGIWKVIVPEIMKRPIAGFGYYAFWTGISGEAGNVMMTPGNREVANAENPILQIALELGFVGVGCLLFTLACCCRNAFLSLRAGSTPYTRWCTTILFITLLALVDGEKIMFPHTIEWLLFVIAYVGLSKEAHRVAVEPRKLKGAV